MSTLRKTRPCHVAKPSNAHRTLCGVRITFRINWVRVAGQTSITCPKCRRHLHDGTEGRS